MASEYLKDLGKRPGGVGLNVPNIVGTFEEKKGLTSTSANQASAGLYVSLEVQPCSPRAYL